MVLAERLRAVLLYDPETGVFTRRINRGKWKAGAQVGWLRPDGYIGIGLDYHEYLAHRLAWLYVTGEWPIDVDHENTCRSDNRWDNLREASRSQNMRNMKRTKANTSGYKGVTWHKVAKKWMAQIQSDVGHKYLGLFDDPHKAHQAYAEAAVRMHGEFARTV